MESTRQVETFAQWYSTISGIPIKDDFAFGRRFEPGREPKLHGANARRKLRAGTLVLWPEALVFLPKFVGAKWWMLFILCFVALLGFGTVVGLITGETPSIAIFVGTLGLISLITWVYKQKLNIASAGQVLRAAAHRLSLFIPLTRIRSVTHEYQPRSGLRPALELIIIEYVDESGQKAVALFGEPDGSGYGKGKFRAFDWARTVQDNLATAHSLGERGAAPLLCRSRDDRPSDQR